MFQVHPVYGKRLPNSSSERKAKTGGLRRHGSNDKKGPTPRIRLPLRREHILARGDSPCWPRLPCAPGKYWGEIGGSPYSDKGRRCRGTHRRDLDERQLVHSAICSSP